jgi:hypothetical protein
MSQPIHTPGPVDLLYEVEDHDPDDIILRSTHDGLNMGICQVFESRANARLLAAAYNAFDSAAKRLGVNAVLLAEGLQRAGIADLISALEQAREHIDGEIDVVDGDYGVPAPNKAMSLAQEIDAALAKVKGAAP